MDKPWVSKCCVSKIDPRLPCSKDVHVRQKESIGVASMWKVVSWLLDASYQYSSHEDWNLRDINIGHEESQAYDRKCANLFQMNNGLLYTSEPD